jgi:hypothetical protein
MYVSLYPVDIQYCQDSNTIESFCNKLGHKSFYFYFWVDELLILPKLALDPTQPNNFLTISIFSVDGIFCVLYLQKLYETYYGGVSLLIIHCRNY